MFRRYSREGLCHEAEEAPRELHGVVDGEVTVRVLQVLLDPAGQPSALVRACETLRIAWRHHRLQRDDKQPHKTYVTNAHAVREDHEAVIGLPAQHAPETLRRLAHRVEHQEVRLADLELGAQVIQSHLPSNQGIQDNQKYFYYNVLFIMPAKFNLSI